MELAGKFRSLPCVRKNKFVANLQESNLPESGPIHAGKTVLENESLKSAFIIQNRYNVYSKLVCQ